MSATRYFTPEQQAANLVTARRVAATRVGVGLGPNGELETASIPYEKREAFATELSALILAKPEQYPPDAVAAARRESTDRPNDALEKFTVSDGAEVFTGAVVAQAERVGEAVASVGEGAITTARLAKWVLPVAALVAVFILLRNFSRRSA